MSGLIPMTAENFERLCAELETLKTTERRQIRADLAHAMSFGDFSENAELDEAKRAHSALEGRIAQLEKMISRVEVIALTESDQVSVGATVIVADLGTEEEICFRVGVGGHDDGDAIMVTPDSPLGRGLMGKRAEDEIEVETPAGKQSYRILSIEYPGIGGSGQERKESQMEILVNIPVEFNIETLLSRLHLSEGSADAASVIKLAEWAKSVANPKAIYDICYLEDKSPDTATIGGVTFTSRVLSANLGQAHRAFPFIATCGKELEAQPNITGDMMEFYWLDEIKQMALMAAFDYMQKHIANTYQLGKISHMFTGSLEDWPLTQQAQLFSLFGDSKEQIGVELTDSFLMVPTKSLSGIFFPTETKYEDCQLCPREGCPGRRARYDEELWRKYSPE